MRSSRRREPRERQENAFAGTPGAPRGVRRKITPSSATTISGSRTSRRARSCPSLRRGALDPSWDLREAVSRRDAGSSAERLLRYWLRVSQTALRRLLIWDATLPRSFADCGGARASVV